MACIVEQNVLGFEIAKDYVSIWTHSSHFTDVPVHDVEIVQVFKRAQKLSSIEPASIFIKLPFSLQVVEQLATVDWKSF